MARLKLKSWDLSWVLQNLQEVFCFGNTEQWSSAPSCAKLSVRVTATSIRWKKNAKMDRIHQSIIQLFGVNDGIILQVYGHKLYLPKTNLSAYAVLTWKCCRKGLYLNNHKEYYIPQNMLFTLCRVIWLFMHVALWFDILVDKCLSIVWSIPSFSNWAMSFKGSQGLRLLRPKEKKSSEKQESHIKCVKTNTLIPHASG